MLNLRSKSLICLTTTKIKLIFYCALDNTPIYLKMSEEFIFVGLFVIFLAISAGSGSLYAELFILYLALGITIFIMV
jgi:hypothetical protein